ncbi:MAG: DUF4173 domain-containing protein [Acidimicrobiia bacterium]|nr:DUF4173 domain-containing protein [Acidimicrobiia bacterium]MDH4308955.1 DUF4173 domain-containing protein [Acidimicrobiia bacterium]
MAVTISSPQVLRRPALTIALATLCGLSVDLLAWARPHGPGLAIGLAAVVTTVWWHIRGLADLQTATLLTGATGFALVPVWRDSTTVVVLAALSTIGLLAVAVARCGGTDLRRWTLGTYSLAATEPIIALAETIGFLSHDAAFGHPAVRAGAKKVLPLTRGLVLLLLTGGFFALLFGSADPIFADVAARAFDLDLSVGRIIRGLGVSAAIAWLVIGSSRRAAAKKTDSPPYSPKGRGLLEARIMLTGINALFAVFLVIQFRFLFAGVADDYSTYARRGFFQLVVVAAAVTALILAMDWLVSRRDRVLDVLSAALVLQTFVVMASALVRMNAYTTAFGLSELRLYTTVFMIWVGILLVALITAVLRGDRNRFALVAFLSGAAFIAGLVVANPDARIADVNIDRGLAGSEVDVDYLASLSSDAIPVLVRRADELDAPDLMSRLEAKLADEISTHGWRSWSFSDHSAARAITADQPPGGS